MHSARSVYFFGLSHLSFLCSFVGARVVINEVSPAGTVHGPCAGLEFFELLNLGDSAVDLSSLLLTVEYTLPCVVSRIDEAVRPFWDGNTILLTYRSRLNDAGDNSSHAGDNPRDADDGDCLESAEVPYYSFQQMGTAGRPLAAGERRAQCIPTDPPKGWPFRFFRLDLRLGLTVPLLWHAIQFGWPRRVSLYESPGSGALSWAPLNSSFSPRLVDRSNRLPPLPSARFEFDATVDSCRQVMSDLTTSELRADLAGIAWARVPDGIGNFTAVGRSTPGETNTRCRLSDFCMDCPTPSKYQIRDRRCACQGGTWLSSASPLQCSNCEPGRFSSQIDVGACDACQPGWGAGRGQTSCQICPLHTFSQGGTVCSPCPNGLLTQSEGAGSITSCICAKGQFLVSQGKCRPCGWPYTSEYPGATSAEECILDSRVLMPYVIGTCVFVVAAICVVAYWCLWRHHKDQKDRKMRDDLGQGLAAIYSPQYPLCLISLIDFCNMTQDDLGACHEGARDAGQLLCLDSKRSIDGFKSLGHKILFFSYMWTSWEKLGPNPEQVICMKAAAKRICAENHVDPEHFFVWLDILGIPQANNCCKSLAVHSLYVYASSADFLVVICPPCFHEQTGEMVDAASYRSRVWCRVEQMAHCLQHGFETMYVSWERGQLDMVNEHWISDALHVFEGEVTCCRLHHPNGKTCDKELLVPTVLAMYADTLSKVRVDGSVVGPDDLQIVWDMICKDISRFLPRHFTYVNESGRRSTRVLFGKTVEWVHGLAQRDQLSVVDDLREESLKSEGSVTTVDVESSFKCAMQAVSQRLRLNHGVGHRRLSKRASSSQLFAARSPQQLRRQATGDLARSSTGVQEAPVAYTATPRSESTVAQGGGPEKTRAMYVSMPHGSREISINRRTQ
eukprot:TRINITY_DN9405_c0_g2_i3.p1 TRINITY_DN9405_c0_g2~~TRINITY_DN9405_c0_g2_i3.p1  ORF type:complete len:901 (-),score=27.94 TRINITY_DN9405_c0_g2_i3:461-3163(-)